MKSGNQAVIAVLFAGALAYSQQTQAFSIANGIEPRQPTPAALKTAGAVSGLVVTAATGGEAIPVGAWTVLTGPILTETYARNLGGLGLGTIVLVAPAGFEFNPGASVTVIVHGYGPKTINGVPNGGTIPAIVTPTNITLTITSVSRGGLAYPNTLTFQNIQVRPAVGNVVASGNITETGTCQFRGLKLSTGTWGLLQKATGPTPNVTMADPLGDWDGDGRSNLMEYALGTDPTNPNDNGLGMRVWILAESGNQYVALSFRKRSQSALPIQYLPEVSGDKQTWYSDASHVVPVSVTPVDSQFDWVTVRDAVPLAPSTPRFIRLTVMEN